ncbi:hypothetical protein LTS18_015159, partial [Coniosporium uncinatum]
YPPADDVSTRLQDFIRDSAFSCNVRYVTDAYAGKTYNARYARGSGLHGTDLLANFWATGNFLLDGLATFAGIVNIGQLGFDFPSFAKAYQSYLGSYATLGDPNRLRADPFIGVKTINWPTVTQGAALSNVLDAGDRGFNLVTDNEQALESNCAFWTNALAALTNLGGYAPSDSIVDSNLLNDTIPDDQATRNYQASGTPAQPGTPMIGNPGGTATPTATGAAARVGGREDVLLQLIVLLTVALNYLKG